MDSLMTIRILVQAQQAIAQLNAVNSAMSRTAAVGRSTNAGGGFAAATTGASNFVSRGLEPATAATKKFGTALSNAFDPQKASKLQWLGRQLTYNFSMPLGIAAVAATKWALSTETAVTRVAKVYGDGTAAFNKMVGTYADMNGIVRPLTMAEHEVAALARSFVVLSDTYGVAQSDVANIGADWAQAGASGIAVAKATQQTLRVMVLGEMSAVDATTALISVQAQYGLSTDQLARAMDVLNMVENTTAVKFSDLLTVFTNSAGPARQAGVDIRHLAAMAASLVPAAGSAATAGNSIKTMLTRILNPTKNGAAIMKEMGISIDSVTWQSQNGSQRLETLAKAFSHLTAGQKAAAAATLGSVYQINKFDTLMADMIDPMGRYQKSLRATLDPARNFAQAQKELNLVLNSNPQKMKQIWTMLQNAAINIIQPLIPIIVSLGQQVADLFTKFSNLSPVLQKFISIMLLVVIVAGPALRLFGAFRVLLFALVKPLLIVGEALFGLGKIALIVAKVILAPFKILGLAIFKLLGMFSAALQFMLAQALKLGPAIGKAWQAFGAVAGAIWRGIAFIVAASFDIIKSLIQVIMTGVMAVMRGLGPAFQAIGRALGFAVAYGWVVIEQIIATTSAVMTGVQKIVMRAILALEPVMAFFATAWAAMLSLIKDLTLATGATITYIWNGMLIGMSVIGDAFRAGWVAANILLVKAWALVTDAMEAIWAAAHRAMLAIGGLFATAYNAVWGAIKTVAAATWTAMVAVWNLVHMSMLGISAAFGRAWAALQSAMRILWGATLLFMGAAWFTFTKYLAGLWWAFNVIFDGGLKAIGAGFMALISGIGKLIAGAFGFLFSVPGLILAALVLVVIIFRKQLLQLWDNLVTAIKNAQAGVGAAAKGVASIWGSVVNFIIGAFNKLPEGIQGALMAVVKMVSSAAKAVYHMFSYMNPFAKHSPSLVDSVKGGMGVVADHYKKTDKVGQVFSNATSHLNTFKAASKGLPEDPMTDYRSAIAKVRPSALPAFDQSAKDLRNLTALQNQYGAAVTKQTAVVDSYQKTLDGLNATLDKQNAVLAKNQATLQGLQDQYDKAKQAASDYANAPLKGMQAMSDAMFNNDIAAKKLQLQMADWKKTHGSIADVNTQIQNLQGSIETLQSRKSELRSKGAGSEILGPIQAQIDAYKKQQATLSKGTNNDPYTAMEKKLAKLNDEGTRLSLLNSITFDPLTRQLNKMANSQKEISYDDAVKGIKKQQAAMEALTPKIAAATTAVAKQQKVVDQATVARDAGQAAVDRETKKLQALKDMYDKLGAAISEITNALNEMGAAADKIAEKKVKIPKEPKIKEPSQAIKNFEAGAKGDWPDPGGKTPTIGREGGLDDQSKQIDAWTKAQTDALSKSFGSIDMFKPIRDKWNDFTAWWKKNISPQAALIWKGIKDAFSSFGNLFDGVDFGGQAKKIFKPVMDVVDPIVKFFKDVWAALWPTLKTGFDSAWTGIKDAWKLVSDSFKPFIDNVWPVLKGIFRALVIAVSGAIGIVVGVLGGLWNAIGPAFRMLGGIISGVMDALGGFARFIKGFFEVIRGIFSGNGGMILKGWHDMWNGIMGVAGALIRTIWAIIKGAFQMIVSFIQGFFKTIWALVQKILPGFAKFGEGIVHGLWNGIKTAWNAFLGFFKGIFTGVIDFVKGIFGIHSPSTVFGDIGEAIIQGLWNGIKGLAKLIYDAGTWLLNKLWDGIKFVWNSLISWFGSIGTWIWDKIKTLASAIKDIGTKVFNWIGNAIVTAAVFYWNWFAKIGTWIWNKIKVLAKTIGAIGTKVWNWIGEAIKAAAVAIWTWFGKIGTWIWDKIKVLAKSIGWIGTRVWNWIGEAVKTAAVAIWNWFGRIGTWIWDRIKGLGKAIGDIGTRVWNWIGNSIRTAAVAIWNWFGRIGTWIWDRIKGLGKAIGQIGINVWNWIANAVTSTATKLGTWFSNIGSWIWDKIKTLGKIIGNSGSQLLNWIWTGFTGALSTMANWFANIGTWIMDHLKKVISSISSIGKSIIGWIVDGITGAASKIWDAITGIFKGKPAGTVSLTVGQGGATGNHGATPHRAAGGWIHGPGGERGDKIHLMASDNEFVVKARSAKKHRRLVETINDHPESIPHFADGGWVAGIPAGALKTVKTFGANWSDLEGRYLRGQLPRLRSEADLALLGNQSGLIHQDPALSGNQDPSTFGWAVGRNIKPFNYQGNNFPAGVAGGTESIWRSFLSNLVPIIPGGIIPGGNWGYENRSNVNSPGRKSFHAYGLALDVNSPMNPNRPGTTGPSGSGRGQIPASADAIAKKFGMLWGGAWGDPMHFELHLSPSDVAANASVGGIAPSDPSMLAGVSADVQRWVPTMKQALQKVSQFNLPNLMAGMHQMHTESGGNPNAINLWDSNAQAGHPSKGLMQLIDTTFNRFSQFGYSDNIYDPLSNILSSINYTVDTYGSLLNGWRGHGYQNGGLVGGRGNGRSDSNLVPASLGEFIIPADMYRKNKNAIDSIYAGGSRPTGSSFASSSRSLSNNASNSTTTINIYGDLSFPNIKTGNDASELISGVSRMAKMGAR